MIIQHNIPALNSYNKLATNNSAVQKNLEKLSSGYRINRAGDDAAGLAISEKMRAQITGLERAKLNAQDGISLVQTAEGALTEVHSILNRLVELGTESANGIYQADDREKIQSEVEQSLEEINRISKATNFNGINLLDGSLGGSAGAFSKAIGGNATFTTTDATQGSFKVAAGGIATTNDIKTLKSKDDTISVTVNYTVNGKENSVTASYKLANGESASGNEAAIQSNLMDQLKNSALGQHFTISGNGSAGLEFTSKVAGAAGGFINNISGQTRVDGKDNALTARTLGTQTAGTDAYTTIAGVAQIGKSDDASTIEKNIFEVNGQKFAFVSDSAAAMMMAKDYKDVNVVQGAVGTAADANKMAALIAQKTGLKTDGNNGLKVYATGTSAGGANGLTLQIGDTADSFNKVTVNVDDMSSNGLGINGLQVTDQGIAADSITRIKGAIEKVSTNRGRLGALQNRLEHTINNLSVTTENMTAAESRVRDTDMAKEMMNFTKNNVLVQSAQAMLAQANQQPQQVLQLLR